MFVTGGCSTFSKTDQPLMSSYAKQRQRRNARRGGDVSSKLRGTAGIVDLLQLHSDRMDAFIAQRDVELPAMREQIANFRRVLAGEMGLTDAMANAVFKDHALLSNFRLKEKYRRKRANGEHDSKSLANSAEHNITNENFTRLEKAHKEHTNYLRRLKGKCGERLSHEEHWRIGEYINEKTAWADDVESAREFLEYLFETAPIIRKYEREMVKVNEYMAEEQEEMTLPEADSPVEEVPAEGAE